MVLAAFPMMPAALPIVPAAFSMVPAGLGMVLGVNDGGLHLELPPHRRFAPRERGMFVVVAGARSN